MDLQTKILHELKHYAYWDTEEKELALTLVEDMFPAMTANPVAYIRQLIFERGLTEEEGLVTDDLHSIIQSVIEAEYNVDIAWNTECTEVVVQPRISTITPN
jgi:hypothetical protein